MTNQTEIFSINPNDQCGAISFHLHQGRLLHFGKRAANSPVSQSVQILAYMQSGRSITPLEALNRFGCMRLGARIYDLKRAGYVVVSEMVRDKRTGKKYARYSLAGVKS